MHDIACEPETGIPASTDDRASQSRRAGPRPHGRTDVLDAERDPRAAAQRRQRRRSPR